MRNDLRWYAENISTDFYSEYHRYFPDRPVNCKFVETREQHKKDRASKEPLKRHPSLTDATWLSRIHDRLVETAKFYAPYRPLFNSLGDKSEIADPAAFWDFDFCDESLVPMRRCATRPLRQPPRTERAVGYNLPELGFRDEYR